MNIFDNKVQCFTFNLKILANDKREENINDNFERQQRM